MVLSVPILEVSTRAWITYSLVASLRNSLALVLEVASLVLCHPFHKDKLNLTVLVQAVELLVQLLQVVLVDVLA